MTGVKLMANGRAGKSGLGGSDQISTEKSGSLVKNTGDRATICAALKW